MYSLYITDLVKPETELKFAAESFILTSVRNNATGNCFIHTVFRDFPAAVQSQVLVVV